MSQLQWLVTLSLTCGLLAMFVVMCWYSYRTGVFDDGRFGANRISEMPGWSTARRVVIGVIGFSVVLVGVAMMVLPGPAIVVIPAGLAILATEFAWARRLLRRVKAHAQKAGKRIGVGNSLSKKHKAEDDEPPDPHPDTTHHADAPETDPASSHSGSTQQRNTPGPEAPGRVDRTG